MVQEIVTYALLGLAVIFLLRKYFFTPKKKKNCKTDCGC